MPDTICDIRIRGTVQGVGFRPFVYRLAHEIGLKGWVRNDAQGVLVRAAGTDGELAAFCSRLRNELPPAALITGLELSPAAAMESFDSFSIRATESAGALEASLPPDLAICRDCLAELSDPHNRRYRYPFINCTNCGPRYSIIEHLPYDRPMTTMRQFKMCAACSAEYSNPMDRRFHAQPNACPDCGPHLALWSPGGETLAEREAALSFALDVIKQGQVLAVKGIGGFHLVVDARNDLAVRNLRIRKRREAKPFAVMFPDAGSVNTECKTTVEALNLLASAESPIVLLERGAGELSAFVAPNNPFLGVMLPYTPLHWLLLDSLKFPVVATSGNLSDEPICTDEVEALDRLRGIADYFLVHNRPIARPLDDSVVRFVGGKPLLMRRSRGYAPRPVAIPESLRQDPARRILAVGAHLKDTVAVSDGRSIFVGAHIGDLSSGQASSAFRQSVESLSELLDVEPELICCDLHPDYLSSQWAAGTGKPLHRVQHHYAHCLSGMAEYALQHPLLGVSWDGTGLGDDGTIWGGEFLEIQEHGYRRAAHLHRFRLPGGDAAAAEPRRAALSLLLETFSDWRPEFDALPLRASLSGEELRIFSSMIRSGFNSPWTSSAGRLFDGVSALLGCCAVNRFEGDAAMQLEFLAQRSDSDGEYGMPLVAGEPAVLNWKPMLEGITEDILAAEPSALIARKFHNTLARAIARTASSCGARVVLLSGGCFQNALLAERALSFLHDQSLTAYLQRTLPPNDNGISLGQVLGALRDYPNHRS